MRRGVLRLYLGAAPGVGKTYAMLNEGWRRKQRGTDVVIGYVETHGRSQTAAQIRDLEVVPRREIEYRGQRFEEMDVDAIRARRPEVVLVDELAHTNVPGSQNRKRWHDVDELLQAGITVISTVNVQHLESLNDVVEQITGVAQQETVPDAVVRAADQIELVDMDPDALRRRMAHGNIYGPDKIDTALANYFRPGNLTALRELALLWVADRVDEALHDYRVRHGISDPWETKERVMVTVSGAPGGDDLIRRAARTAMRTKGELIGVHVVSGDGLSGPSTEALARHVAFVEELGGRYVEVVSDDVATALVQAARAENATQLMMGATRRTRWEEVVHGSVINRVLRQTGEWLDVHVISTSAADDPDDPPGRVSARLHLAPLSRRRQVIAFALALAGLPLLTVLLSGVRDSVGLQNAMLCYLLLVVAVATIGGVWPAAVASVLGFVLLNWFFAPPIHTFTIANGRDLLALFAFLVVATVISALVDLAARRRSDAVRARSEASALAGLPLLTVLLSGVRDSVGLQNAMLCYLLLVVAVATIGGVWPAAVASVLGFVLLNWFFAPPIHTFTIANGRDLLALFAFLVVATVISALVDVAARRRSDAVRARSEASALARMAAVVLRDPDPLPRLLGDLVVTFGLDGAAVLGAQREGWVIQAGAGPAPPSSPVDASTVLNLPNGATLALRGRHLRADDNELLGAFATQLGVAFETRRLQAEAADAEALRKANELRTALLAAVSHDLRTPLASIKASATSLLSEDVAFEPAAVRALLETIDEESDRLNALVGNLLDMSRLQTGALVVQAQPVGLEEVVALALAGLPSASRAEVDVDESLPRVRADVALLERAVANLIGNALSFSPDDSVVRVQAGAVGGGVALRIVDRGCGIAAADRGRVFQPFQRLGDSPNGSGVGLGLAVAKGFIEAMGGDLTVDDTPGGGCTMTVSLPRAEE